MASFLKAHFTSGPPAEVAADTLLDLQLSTAKLAAPYAAACGYGDILAPYLGGDLLASQAKGGLLPGTLRQAGTSMSS